MSDSRVFRAAGAVSLCVALGAAAFAYRGGEAPGREAAAQDVAGLERRVTSLEQRLYLIESRIGRLEQQAALKPQAAPPPASGLDTEVGLLRGAVESLRRRLGEVECGVVKLDERTTRPEAREARERAAKVLPDPCRLDSESPVKLLSRP